MIEYHYSNTHTSTSVYRAFGDRVEPVSYRQTSSVGQAFLAILLILPAYLLAALYTAVRGWWTRRKELD